ncbi:AraC family transcriptional regulator [Enterobacter hormaechei]|uniref:AraC family transcriptional regulator n=1 Tax=Enterobacter hormaechei TaxID=158836 RepID=UPI0037529D5F
MQQDWLSHLLDMISVTGQLEVRCAFGGPWRVVYEHAATGEIPYHIVTAGKAILENPSDGTSQELHSGDIVLLPHGAAHVLHDGSGLAPLKPKQSASSSLIISENDGVGAHLDMLCGRFLVPAPYHVLVERYLPERLVVSTQSMPGGDELRSQISGLVNLIRFEAQVTHLGARAMLNALSTALFTLTLRAASSDGSDNLRGLLQLAADKRLAPALFAILDSPSTNWTLPQLAEICLMSRSTFIRQFEKKLGKSALDLLTDIRMGVASEELLRSGSSTEAIAEMAGYSSVAAFRRKFRERIGMTPGEWRKQAD